MAEDVFRAGVYWGSLIFLVKSSYWMSSDTILMLIVGPPAVIIACGLACNGSLLLSPWSLGCIDCSGLFCVSVGKDGLVGPVPSVS